MLACSLHWPFPIFHDLRHCRCNATCRAITWNKHIIWIPLTPFRGKQRFHHFISTIVCQSSYCPHHFPLSGCSLIGFNLVFDTILYLIHKTLQIALQLYGDVFGVKLAFIGIAKDRRGTIISSHNDKTIWRVEDVESNIATANPVCLHQLQFINALHRCLCISVHKFKAHLAGSIYVDRIGAQSHHIQQQVEQDSKSRPSSM